MGYRGITLPADSRMARSDFVFGVATSAFQIEGAADQRLESIWDRFCQQPGAIRDNSNGQIACAHLAHWQEDVAMIHSLGVDAYRFSVSWPRVMHANGQLNQQGVDFYLKLLDQLQALDIKPFVTLYHWDLPQHLDEQGGWLSRDTAFRFRDYCDAISRAFGERVHSYATLNEPYCSAYLSYELGIHAPGKKHRPSALQAAHHLLLAHGLAMEVLSQNSPNALNGVVLNLSPCHSATARAEDVQAADYADQYFNQWYLQPILEGQYPALMQQIPEQDRPTIQDGDLATIAQPLDYLGVNYYTRGVYFRESDEWFTAVEPRYVPLTDMGWEIYPQGLQEVLLNIHQRYSLPPIYITENGAALPEEWQQQQVLDHARIDYLDQHLSALDTAMKQGVDVRGYFAWSLMDNFEWAEGYLKRFGLVHVDFETQKRTLKSSALAWRHMLQRRRAANGLNDKRPIENRG